MANRQIKVDILADAKGFQKGTGQAQQSASFLEKALGRLGPVGKSLQGVLDKVGLSSVGAGAGIGAGAVALGAAYAFAQKAIGAYVDLGSKVRDYSIITGQSAEASSRQVQAFQELGVGEDVAAAGMVKLSKAIETSPKKLEEVGVAVARDAKGNVDLGATLLNVASAWQQTTDAARRNEIVLAAFGKAGASMIPILEANAAQLARLEAQARTVFSAEDLKQIHDYQIAQRELDRSTQDLGNSIGRTLLPAQLAAVQSANENIYVWNHLDEELAKMGAAHSQSRVAIMEAGKALRDEYRASLDAQQQADSLAQSQADAAKQAKAEADAENALYDTLHKALDANFALTQAQIDLSNAQQRVKETGGKDAEANLRLQEAYVKVADAAVAQAAAQAEANGATLSAEQKADIYRQTLQKLADQLGPGDPLRKDLQGYIDQLDSIPSAIGTDITANFGGIPGRTGGRVSTQHFAGGGIVGGSSEDHPVMASRGEGVFTPEQMAALPGLYAGGGGAGKVELTVILQGGILTDGPSIDRLAGEVARRLSYVTGR